MRNPYVLILTLALLLAACNAQRYLAKSKATVTSTVKLDYTVRLVADNGFTFCSGTVVSDHTIITAAHCIVEDTIMGPMLRSGTITIRVDDNIDRKVVALPLKANIQMDTALLTGDFRMFKHANYISDVTKITAFAKVGQPFKSCGFPLGGHLYCNTMLFKDIDVFMWHADKGLLLPGMSGGPVFVNDFIAGESVIATNTAMDGDSAVISPLYNIQMSVK